MNLWSVAVAVGQSYALVMVRRFEISIMDWADCPLVEINPRKVSGTPILKGTRMPADAIVENYLDGLPAEEIAEVFELPSDSVRALITYAVQHNLALKP